MKHLIFSHINSEFEDRTPKNRGGDEGWNRVRYNKAYIRIGVLAILLNQWSQLLRGGSPGPGKLCVLDSVLDSKQYGPRRT